MRGGGQGGGAGGGAGAFVRFNATELPTEGACDASAHTQVELCFSLGSR